MVAETGDCEQERLKLVIVGDGASGKTSLLATFSQGVFPLEYVPTIFDNRVCAYRVDQFDIGT